MLGIEDWLGHLPVMVIYLLVGGIILLESMGVPLPGEITLVSASLLAASGVTSVWGVAISAATGAIIGDSIGYAIGRRGGRALLERFGRRFPKHFGPAHLARAERTFDKWGVWAVFFGRFVALLRILAGPLAGTLNVPYRKFLIANASGGILWAFGTAFVIYSAGQAAEKYLKGFSWIALVVALLFGIGTTFYLRHRAARAHELLDDDDPATNPSPAAEIAAIAVDAAQDGVASAVHRRKTAPAGSKGDGQRGGNQRGAARNGKKKSGTQSGRRPPKPRRS
jgi:membrane protein DedA with SNARE-associated domain